jgi:hypothetical protein
VVGRFSSEAQQLLKRDSILQFNSLINNTKTHFNMASIDVREDTFPSRSREVSGVVNGVATEITSTNFADKVLITISQEGRLSQWVYKYYHDLINIPLTSQNRSKFP